MRDRPLRIENSDNEDTTDDDEDATDDDDDDAAGLRKILAISHTAVKHIKSISLMNI